MNNTGIWIRNASIVFPDQVSTGSVYIENHKIKEISLNSIDHIAKTANMEIIEAEGMLLLPGLIDIHCDAIEKEVEPRPNTLFPLNLALFELEKKLAASGITTMYHSLSLGVGLSLRGADIMKQMLDCIKQYRIQRSMIRHRIHLRYEITYFEGLPLAEELIENGTVDYLSFMNHAPGIGQYKSPGSFEAYVMKNQGVDKHEVKEIANQVLKLQDEIDWHKLQEIADKALHREIRIASHDDDSIEQVDAAIARGISISEFPLNLETAMYAKENNISVCVGAPNIVRGGSHDKNMKALDAVKAGAVDIVCSDYSPSSLLHSVFKLKNERIHLSDAVNMASLNPARSLGINDQVGSIEIGKDADMILVELIDGYPSIRKTIVGGSVVYHSDFCYRL